MWIWGISGGPWIFHRGPVHQHLHFHSPKKSLSDMISQAAQPREMKQSSSVQEKIWGHESHAKQPRPARGPTTTPPFTQMLPRNGGPLLNSTSWYRIAFKGEVLRKSSSSKQPEMCNLWCKLDKTGKEFSLKRKKGMYGLQEVIFLDPNFFSLYTNKRYSQSEVMFQQSWL